MAVNTTVCGCSYIRKKINKLNSRVLCMPVMRLHCFFYISSNSERKTCFAGCWVWKTIGRKTLSYFLSAHTGNNDQVTTHHDNAKWKLHTACGKRRKHNIHQKVPRAPRHHTHPSTGTHQHPTVARVQKASELLRNPIAGNILHDISTSYRNFATVCWMCSCRAHKKIKKNVHSPREITKAVQNKRTPLLSWEPRHFDSVQSLQSQFWPTWSLWHSNS